VICVDPRAGRRRRKRVLPAHAGASLNAVNDHIWQRVSARKQWSSVVTEKASECCIIYEYCNKYWIIEESCQLWPDDEGPTERVPLTGSLPQCYTSLEMGELTFQALDNFNSKKPKFRPWQLKELRKDLCSWVGAKGWPSFYKNT